MRQPTMALVNGAPKDTVNENLQWGDLSADSLTAHIVAADTLYTLYFMEEVSARLGWAWEPRE